MARGNASDGPRDGPRDGHREEQLKLDNWELTAGIEQLRLDK